MTRFHDALRETRQVRLGATAARESAPEKTDFQMICRHKVNAGSTAESNFTLNGNATILGADAR